MSFRTITHRYDGPRRTFRKTVPCHVCGKKLRRQRTIEHTVNPFNQNEDGTQETWDEVLQDVIAKGKAWIAEPERCATDCSPEET
jgi:hypothetical protein